MKLRRIELEQVRKFEGRVVVDGIDDGLNLIVGANEAGKSTLLAGLRAALFLKHGSARARDLQHHRHRTAPRVALEVEVDGERVFFEKRFLQRPQASLRAGGVTLTGEAAETAFAARLCGAAPSGAACPGLWNLLLVGQGEAGDHSLPADARGLLQASLEAQLDSVTGAASVKHLSGRLEERLYGQKGLIDRRNLKPKGRLRELEQALARHDDQLRDLNERRERLRADVDRLSGLLAEQAQGQRPQDDYDHAIAALEAREAELLVQAEAAARAARAALALHQAQGALERRRALIGTLDEVTSQLETLQAAAGQAIARRDRALTEGERLALQAKQEDAVIAAATAWWQATHEAERMLSTAAAGATEVTFALEEGAPGRVRLNGHPPGSRRFRIRVSQELTVAAEDLGRITVRPAQAQGLRDALAEIRGRADAARAVLDRLGVAQAFDFTAAAAFAEGLGRLRVARSELDGRLQEAREGFRDARQEADRTTREVHALHERRVSLAAELAAARASASDAALEMALAGAAAAGPDPATMPADADPQALDAARAQLRGLRNQRDAARQQRHDRDKEIAALSERIAALQGAGLKEEIDEVLRRRTQVEQEHAALEREVAVAGLLRGTLIEAEQAVRESYTTPLVARLQPALHELLPGAHVTLDDNLHITAVERSHAGEEAFGQLSHGTREQLAVVARLAFAEILIESGQPCFVVLDDALVFSDDDRLERMFRILEGAAERVQILVLTCRERAFSGLRAKHLRIEAAAPATV